MALEHQLVGVDDGAVKRLIRSKVQINRKQGSHDDRKRDLSHFLYDINSFSRLAAGVPVFQ